MTELPGSPHLARIDLFPIKSLDGIEAAQASLLRNGALVGDRRWAIRDSQGRYINGKRTPAVHRLRTRFAPDLARVTVRLEGRSEDRTFELGRERRALEDFLAQFFGFEVWLDEDAERGFGDDELSTGPTVVSTATLEALAGWFGIELVEARARVRANLEVGGVPAFWEDRLYTREGSVVRFRVGEAVLEGTNPCQRCVVLTRDPWTASARPELARLLMERRYATLPPWATTERFDHFNRLTVNTRRPQPAADASAIRVGDAVEVLGTFPE